MGFTGSDISRDAYMLTGKLQEKGYDWWWHSFTGRNTNTGEEKSFFVEFYLCNPALKESTPVYGQLEENQIDGKKPSYLMVKAGCWGEDAKQIHRFFSWDYVTVKDEAPFFVSADDCYASEELLRGSVEVTKEDAEEHPEYMSGWGKMTWNLTVNKIIPFNVGYGASQLFRKLNAFEMYWHAEGMKTEYCGTVELDGEIYEVRPEHSYGYADKNWGRNFTSPWVWLSSNHIYSARKNRVLKNSVFDIGGGKPRVFGVPLKRKLLSAFYYEGEEYEFNFSKFWTLCRTKFDCVETKDEIIWKVRQQTRNAIMLTEVHCKKAEMLFVNYEAPDGSKRHNRLWNGGTGKGRINLYKKQHGQWLLQDRLYIKNVGCEYGEFDGE